MRILFVDSVGYRPYTCDTLRTEALGGTEATVLRVARSLAKEGLDVSLYQGVDSTRDTAVIDGIRHVGMESLFPTPEVVVHLRSAKQVSVWKGIFPNARHLVWMHDLGGEWLKDEPLIGNEFVCVSDFHVTQFYGEAWRVGQAEALTIHRIYNPVEVDAERQPKVKGRLGFFSSPHKGLSQVTSAFHTMKQNHGRDSLELVIGNPGYLASWNNGAGGETLLGELPHRKVLEEMSKCEVLFYPQTVFPETFGLVLAESEAMGTPVLAHDMGAASEVCGPLSKVVDCNNPITVQDALMSLLRDKPQPVPDLRFSIEAVTKQWKELLNA